jgi:glycosyltransferase involved in cell wall biosynthesis
MHIGIDAFRLVGPPTSIGTYTHELIQALTEQSCTFTLYAPRREPGADINRYLDSAPSVRVVFAKKPTAPERSPKDLFVWNQFTLPRLMKENNCDVFIAPYQQVPCFTPRDIPTLVVIHDLCGLRSDCGYRKFGKAWFRHYWNLYTAARRATSIVPISHATREDMLRRFPRCEPRLAQPIYNQVTGATLDRGEASLHVAPLGIPKDRFILAFGITGPRKGLDIALAGYRLYRQQGGNLPLVLIGMEDPAFLKKHLADAYLADVTCLSRVSACERDSLYRLATCLLFCSRCEGFGYPIAEAMRQGCPVIAPADTPARDLVGDTLQLIAPASTSETANFLHHHAKLSQPLRNALSTTLIRQSLNFADGKFGEKFSSVLLQIVRSKIPENHDNA